MATADLVPTSILSASGWTGATVANLATSDDVRATDGTVGESITVELTNAPGDFDTMNTVTLKIEARRQGTIVRDKTLAVELLDSVSTVLESFTTGILGATDSNEVSSAFARSDSATVIDGWRLRCTVQEGGGMPDTATVEIDKMWVTLDYNVASAAYTLVADTGSYALTGIAAGLKADRNLVAATGSHTLTGIAAGLKADRAMAADVGAYTLTGVAAGLKAGRMMAADVGAYTLTGVAATLIGPATDYTMVAEPGAYTLTGIAAGLQAGRNLVADAGAYTLTGVAAAPKAARALVADQGAYTLAGRDAGLKVGRNLVAETGSYVLTGQAATLPRDYVLTAGVGAYTLTGVAAGLAWSGSTGPAAISSRERKGKTGRMTRSNAPGRASRETP